MNDILKTEERSISSYRGHLESTIPIPPLRPKNNV